MGLNNSDQERSGFNKEEQVTDENRNELLDRWELTLDDTGLIDIEELQRKIASPDLTEIETGYTIHESYFKRFYEMLENGNITQKNLYEFTKYLESVDRFYGFAGLKLEWFDTDSLKFWTFETDSNGLVIDNKTNRRVLDMFLSCINSQTPLKGKKIKLFTGEKFGFNETKDYLDSLPEHIVGGIAKSVQAGLLRSADAYEDETVEENSIAYPSPLTYEERQEAAEEILGAIERQDAKETYMPNIMDSLTNGGLYTVDKNTHIASSYFDEIRNIGISNIVAGSLFDLVNFIERRDLMSGTSGFKLEWFDENSLRYWTLDTNEEGVLLDNQTNRLIIGHLIQNVLTQIPLNGGKIQVSYARKDENFIRPNNPSMHPFRPIGPVQPRVKADETPTVSVSAGDLRLEGGDKREEKGNWFGNLWRRITGR